MNRIASTVSVLSILAVSGLAMGQHTDGVILGDEIAPADRAGWLALGDALFEPVDIDALTGDTGNLGVEYAWGYYWVTHNGDSVTGTQVLIQYDSDWNEVESYLQITNSPAWGHRDGAAIESENRLFFGAEAGEFCEYVFDPGTQRLDLGASGIIGGGAGTVRALAWDPNNEVFYTKDFGGVIQYLDRDGFLIDVAAESTVSAYGAAFDPDAGTIWFNAYIDTALGTTAPNTRLVEWDPATRALTGREFDSVGSAPAGTTYHIPGGLDIAVDGDCVYAVAMNQGGPVDFVSYWEIAGDCAGGGCRADLDGDGVLTLFDFLAFQNAFDAGDIATADFDGDGVLTLFDFLAFQNEFDAGCP